MLRKEIYDNYVWILKQELVKAMGCTEPIAIAFAAATARELLTEMPEQVEVICSGNIMKNVQAVTVPNSKGMKGIAAAAVLGVLGGKADKKLEVLASITDDHIEQAKQLIDEGYCRYSVDMAAENLYLLVKVGKAEQTAAVEISGFHTNITGKWRNEKSIFCKQEAVFKLNQPNKEMLNVRDILIFAEEVDIKQVAEVLNQQIRVNETIAKEGLTNDYGARVGKTLLLNHETDIEKRACASASAGSDARMSGCPLPVIINSGSGNQGITVSLPIVEYAHYLGVGQEKLLRALIISNLVAIHQKRFIGELSAYCSVVGAAAGTGAAITYLHGGDYERICNTITNTLGTVGGIVCDGAKPSCAAKIASSVQAAINGHNLSMHGDVFKYGEGIIGKDIEETIRNFGEIGNQGMKQTDAMMFGIMGKE